MVKRVSRRKRLTTRAARGMVSRPMMFGNSCANMVFDLRIRKGPKKPAPRKK